MQANIGDGSKHCFFPVIVSYCCNILEGKDISSLKHGLLVQKPCVRCFASLHDVKGFRMARCRMIRDTELAQEMFRECAENFISTERNKEKNINIKW